MTWKFAKIKKEKIWLVSTKFAIFSHHCFDIHCNSVQCNSLLDLKFIASTRDIFVQNLHKHCANIAGQLRGGLELCLPFLFYSKLCILVLWEISDFKYTSMMSYWCFGVFCCLLAEIHCPPLLITRRRCPCNQVNIINWRNNIGNGKQLNDTRYS